MTSGIRIEKPLLAAWILFLSFGLFLALMTPLGEGLDEPWHFAYVQHVAQRHSPPLGNSKFVSSEIDQFLRHHPGSWALHTNFPEVQSYEQYWAQPEPDRAAMDQTMRNLRFSGEFKEAESALAWQYENHQPPLYYALTAPVFAVISRLTSFLSTFLWIRIWTVFLASLTVPAMWMLAQFAFDEKGPREAALLLAVLFPGLYPGVVRVSNDGLTAALACWAFAALIAFLKTEQRRYLFALAALLVAGLWTKVFFVPIVGSALLALLSFRKWRPALLILAAAVLGLPWYIVNYRFSGALTGLPETVIGKITPAMTIDALRKLDWVSLGTVLRSSHIWIGNWSLLGVRRWWYLIIFWIFILALLGFVRRPGQLFNRTVRPLILIYFGIIAALVYYATQVFVHKGITAAEGWYLTSFVPIEALLFAAGSYALLGSRARWLAALLGLCCLVLTVYGAGFVALPYYSGFIHHNPAGAVTSFHPALSDFPLMTSRLLRYSSALPGFVPWLLLLNAIVIGIYCILNSIARSPKRAPGSNLEL